MLEQPQWWDTCTGCTWFARCGASSDKHPRHVPNRWFKLTNTPTQSRPTRLRGTRNTADWVVIFRTGLGPWRYASNASSGINKTIERALFSPLAEKKIIVERTLEFSALHPVIKTFFFFKDFHFIFKERLKNEFVCFFIVIRLRRQYYHISSFFFRENLFNSTCIILFSNLFSRLDLDLNFHFLQVQFFFNFILLTSFCRFQFLAIAILPQLSRNETPKIEIKYSSSKLNKTRIDSKLMPNWKALTFSTRHSFESRWLSIIINLA